VYVIVYNVLIVYMIVYNVLIVYIAVDRMRPRLSIGLLHVLSFKFSGRIKFFSNMVFQDNRLDDCMKQMKQ